MLVFLVRYTLTIVSVSTSFDSSSRWKRSHPAAISGGEFLLSSERERDTT